jgi:hypothetical protein
LVGAILKMLFPRERRLFQSKLGVSSSNQCNLHHSPHTGNLEKKIKKGYNLFRTSCILESNYNYSIIRFYKYHRGLSTIIYYLLHYIFKVTAKCILLLQQHDIVQHY